ncbi:MAG: TonB-dependent receptor [Woeseia sp.]
MISILDPRNTLRLAIAGAVLLPPLPLYAQEERPPMAAPQAPLVIEQEAGEIEEVVVLGRFRSASQQLLDERLNDDSVSDVLDADTISRLGDSTVASALRRVPGLSLVGGRFVYIRGLGERYSATSLNGARIPSPDLTRNVIPLDIFPTSTVQSLKVQKTWSPELPANFGGGSVDIRTKGVPNGFNASLEVGSGYNSNLSGDFLSYPGSSDDDFGADDGSRAISASLLSQVDHYQGNVDVQGILSRLRSDDPSATLADAQMVNRQLGLQLNRDIGLERRNAYPDIGLKGTVGTSFDAGDNFEFGVQASGAYDTQWRKSLAKSRNFNFPEQRTNTEDESTRTVSLTGTLNLGMRFTEDHEFETTTLYLRNTDNETAVRDYFNENREVQDGIGFRNYRFQFEQRDMLVHQLKGTHRFGEATRQMLPDVFEGLLNLLPEDTSVSWFHSDATAETSIPNQVEISSQTVTDPNDRNVLDESVTLDATAADYRFTELDDELQNFGWMAVVPFYTNDSIIETSFGYQHDRKVRTYRQLQFSLGALDVADVGMLGGTLDSVFSDANILNSANNYVFDIRGTNNQSYIAATMTDAVFGKVDWTWKDTWRLAVGARWEDYRQVALDWNPFGYSETNPQITTDPEALARATFASDNIFPSASVTYIGDLWAETFQLRFGWSETAIRPDLREITDASYVDPVTNDLVDGNPGVVPSAVNNYDVRAEWFFSSGDNFTMTLFHKQIDKPIEFFESAASDTTVAREIINADSAEVTGIEIEALKELGFLGSAFDTMFLQGNLTVQDSELVAGPEADAPTNYVRELTGASKYVANVAVGFDSPDARHSASVAYNVFGERLYVAGRNGAPDGFEQPFHSLDLTYSWFPSDTVTIKAKATNLLGEQLEIERAGIVTFEEDPGSSYSLSFTWAL